MIIYHNPRCSKSRQALRLLRDNGIEPKIVHYLKDPLTVSEIKVLINKLGDASQNIVRIKESLFKDLKLKGRHLTLDETAEILSLNPKLLERPIVVDGEKAIIGRPPENVLTLLSD